MNERGHHDSEPAEKKGRGQRGKSAATLTLVQQCKSAVALSCPITVRGVAYRLFVPHLIPSMAKNEVQRVGRAVGFGRKNGDIDWEDIVDETRQIERVQSWRNLNAFAQTVSHSYRRDFWLSQPYNVQVWSEKGTVGGVLRPILQQYGVPFMAVHGFGSLTAIHDAAQEGEKDFDGRLLVILYVGDWDASGMYMSEVDLPKRLKEEGDVHEVRRIALTAGDLPGLPSFSIHEKKLDPRYKWFIKNYGERAWELDAMDPNDLRDRVEAEILRYINMDAWKRMQWAEDAEQATVQKLVTALAGLPFTMTY